MAVGYQGKRTAGPPREWVAGVVEQVAANGGWRLAGVDRWCDWSRGATDRTELEAGQAVRMQVQPSDDGRKFWVYAVQVEDGTGAPGEAPRQVAPSRQAAPSGDRERLIIRQTAGKIAAQVFAGSGNVDAVLAAMDRIEAAILAQAAPSALVEDEIIARATGGRAAVRRALLGDDERDADLPF